MCNSFKSPYLLTSPTAANISTLGDKSLCLPNRYISLKTREALSYGVNEAHLLCVAPATTTTMTVAMLKSVNTLFSFVDSRTPAPNRTAYNILFK